jgi:hypothetical protein
MKTTLLEKTRFLAIMMMMAGTMLYAQVDHFQLGFGGSLPPGWVGDGIYMTSTASNRNTTYAETFGGTHAIKMLIPCQVTTKGYYTAGTLSFWIYEKNEGDGYVKVEKSTDNGATWTEIDSIVYETTASDYAQHTYDLNDNSPSVMIRWKSGLKEFYMDDASLTSMPPADDNAYLLSLSVNGKSFDEFETAQTQYETSITYPTAVIDAVPFNEEASVEIDYPSAEEYFGSEAERTATITVTAKDGTTTETYEILFNVTGYHIQYGFPFTGGNAAADGWEALHTYITNSENNGQYYGDNALRFTKDSGYIHTTKYWGVDTISFYTKVGMNDASAIQDGETMKISAKGGGDIFWTDLGTLTTGTDITDTWKKVEYVLDMTNEEDSVEVRWMVEYENSQTRIYLDDIGISGHPTYMDPSVYPGFENIIPAESMLKVYPNPADEFVFIELPENNFRGQLRVINLVGQEVMSAIINENHSMVNVSGLQAGIYLVTVEAEGKVYNNKLLVK